MQKRVHLPKEGKMKKVPESSPSQRDVLLARARTEGRWEAAEERLAEARKLRAEAKGPLWVHAAEINSVNPGGNKPAPFTWVRVPGGFVEPVAVEVTRQGCFAVDRFGRRAILAKKDRR